MREVLDSRFLVTHYTTDDEQILSRTRAKLAALCRERWGVHPSIVIAEVMNAVCREGGRDKALAQLQALEHAGLEVVPSTSGWRAMLAYKSHLAESGIARTTIRGYLSYLITLYRLKAQATQDP